ncbi:hypothetical protein X757_06505 [Mesorhizobium sp. LSHC414A00]|nr:hypothetical protein X757_06505 [Mesorhizobium sp. LSHC414A00]
MSAADERCHTKSDRAYTTGGHRLDPYPNQRCISVVYLFAFIVFVRTARRVFDEGLAALIK